jgi:hypothetical protein
MIVFFCALSAMKILRCGIEKGLPNAEAQQLLYTRGVMATLAFDLQRCRVIAHGLGKSLVYF